MNSKFMYSSCMQYIYRCMPLSKFYIWFDLVLLGEF